MRKLIIRSDKDLGKFGENLSTFFLRLKGYKILTKNFTTKFGEIDIICKKNKLIVFVEVKTRKNTKYISPKENIDYKKLRKIRKTASYYIQRNCKMDNDYRIDCIEVCMDSAIPVVRHIKGIGYQIDDYN